MKRGSRKLPFIYGLIDPVAPNDIRYVGMAMRDRRPYDHAKNARRKNASTYLLNWIRALQKEDREPAVIVLEILGSDVSRRFVGEIERIYIEVLRALGHRLTNTAEGGYGGATTRGRKHSPETLAKLRRPKTAEARMRMSLAKKGKPRPSPSPETRLKMSVAQKGRPGKPQSAEARRKIGLAGIGRKHTLESRRKMSVALLGHPVSSETREKFRAREARKRAAKIEARKD